jgi:hypothetical protein
LRIFDAGLGQLLRSGPVVPEAELTAQGAEDSAAIGTAVVRQERLNPDPACREPAVGHGDEGRGARRRKRPSFLNGDARRSAERILWPYD